MEKFNYQPSGVCSRLFEFEVEDDKINNLNVIGGCHGNLQGISALLKGMPIDEAIEKLEGIRCHNKPTSCPDQIAKALKLIKKRNYGRSFFRSIKRDRTTLSR